MKPKHDTYLISRATLEKVMDALANNHVSSVGGEDYNNDDIIAADATLEAEVKAQESPASHAKKFAEAVERFGNEARKAMRP